MDVAPAAHAAALWAGLNLVLLLVLSVRVVRLRRRHEVALGDADIPELARAIRAFGNAAEYVPAALAGLAVLALAGAAPALVHLIGAALLVGRIVHAVALSVSGEPSRARSVGALVTWLALILLAVTLIFYALP